MKPRASESVESDAVHSAATTKSAVAGTKATLMGQWLKFFVQFMGTILLARILAPENFGTFAMIMAIAGLATLLGDFGLSTAAMQAKALSNIQKNNLFWLNLAIGFSVAIAFYLSAELISVFYGEPSLIVPIRILAFNFVIQSALAQFTAMASRKMQFNLLAKSDVVAQLLALALAITMALLGAGVYALVFQQIFVSLTLLLSLVIGTRWLPGLPKKAPMRQLVKFGTNSFMVQLVTYISSNADSIAVGKIWGASALGIYDRAFQLFRMPIQQIATPLTRLAVPILSARQDDVPWVSRKLALIQTNMVYGIGSVYFFAAISSKPIIEFLLGEAWLPSAPILAVLAFGGIFQCMGYIYYWAFLVTDNTAIQLRYAVGTRLVMVGLIIIGATHSPVGAAFGFSVGLLINWLVLTAFAMPKTGVHLVPIIRAALFPLTIHMVANIPTFIVAHVIVPDFSPILVLLCLVCSSAAGYALCLLLPKFRHDLRSVLDLVKVATK